MFISSDFEPFNENSDSDTTTLKKKLVRANQVNIEPLSIFS